MSNVQYLKTFFDEKDLDGEHVFEVKSSNGTTNWIPAQCVIDQILVASEKEQDQIAFVLRKIDFANGDVLHFLGFLAEQMAQNL